MQAGSYTNYFADALIAEAELDSRVVGIHAAMGGGTGMNRFEQRFPERTFDVGIAEQVWPGACAPCTMSLYLSHSKPWRGIAPACRLRRHTEPPACSSLLLQPPSFAGSKFTWQLSACFVALYCL
jgi:hypothetical protein